MTRKDYALIAEAIRETQVTRNDDDSHTRTAANAAKALVAKEIARALHRDNSNFDRERFLTACGV